MNIINSLIQIGKNSSNFQRWEVEQDAADAKREELAKKNPPSAQELQNAKSLGKTVIDVVDIMDQHSEDVAENVETATSIPMGFVPLGAFFGSGFLSKKLLIDPALDELSSIEDKFIKGKKETIENLLKRMKAYNPEKNERIYEHHILSNKFPKKFDVSQGMKTEAKQIAEELAKLTKNAGRKAWIGAVIPFASMIAAFVGGNIYATTLQVDSSKVARFQAREVLKNPKYFVQYTPEQTAQAQKALDANSDKNKKKKLHTDKLKSGMFLGLFSVLKDIKGYKAWRASGGSEPKTIDRPLSAEELITANKDKEMIQRVVKKINNNAENYSTNMEVAGNVIIGGTPVLGAIVGWGVSKIMTWTKIIPNMVQNMVNKYGDAEAQAAYTKLKNAPKDNMLNQIGLFMDFNGKMMSSEVEKGIAKDIKLSKIEELQKGFKKFVPMILSTKFGSNVALGFIGSIITGLAGSLIGLKLQKASARAGRFVAKQELEENPQNFIGYTEEDFNSIKNPPKKAKTSKFKEYVMFIPTVFKQYFKYNHYKKTTLKQDKLLQDELTKLDVTDKQLKDAKNLQRKVFNTFEQVDDKSQDYSESVEAVTQTAQPFVMIGGGLAAISPLIYLGVQAFRGKVNAKSIISKVTTILSHTTGIIKSKFAKKYLGDVEKQISSTVENTAIRQVKKTTGKVFHLDKETVEAGLLFLKKGIETVGGSEAGSIKALLAKTEAIIKVMPEEMVKAGAANLAKEVEGNRILERFDFASFDKAYLEKLIPQVQKIIDNVPKEELQKIINTAIAEFKKNPEKFIASVENGSIAKIFLTKKLLVAMTAAGLTWAGLSIVIIYAIETWLADMQLKAGRLGVMKALDSLKDPRYYANVEPETTQNQKNTKLVRK